MLGAILSLLPGSRSCCTEARGRVEMAACWTAATIFAIAGCIAEMIAGNGYRSAGTDSCSWPARMAPLSAKDPVAQSLRALQRAARNRVVPGERPAGSRRISRGATRGESEYLSYSHEQEAAHATAIEAIAS